MLLGTHTNTRGNYANVRGWFGKLCKRRRISSGWDPTEWHTAAHQHSARPESSPLLMRCANWRSLASSLTSMSGHGWPDITDEFVLHAIDIVLNNCWADWSKSVYDPCSETLHLQALFLRCTILDLNMVVLLAWRYAWTFNTRSFSDMTNCRNHLHRTWIMCWWTPIHAATSYWPIPASTYQRHGNGHLHVV